MASKCAEQLKIAKQRILVDAWDDSTARHYGGLANMTFVLDAEGKLAAAYPWMDAKKIKGALDAVLAGKAVPAEFAGPTPASATMAAIAGVGSGGMGLNGPLVGLVSVLDRLKLNDKQREGIYPPLTAYIAAARNLREKRQATTDKAVTPEERQQTLEALRADAEKVRTAFRDNLSAEDAKAATEAFDRSYGGRAMPK